MPFLMGYLVWDQLKQDRDPEPRSSPLGWLFLGAGLALLVLDSAIHSQLLAGAAFVISLPGIALLLLGARRTRAIALPLAIAVFMLPIPAGAIARLYMVLRTLTAVVTAHLVPLLRRAARARRHLADLAAQPRRGRRQLQRLRDAVRGDPLRDRARPPGALAGAARGRAARGRPARAGLQLPARHRAGAPGPRLRLEILETQIHPLSGMVLFVLVIGALLAIAGRDALRGQPGSARPPISDR